MTEKGTQYQHHIEQHLTTPSIQTNINNLDTLNQIVDPSPSILNINQNFLQI